MTLEAMLPDLLQACDQGAQGFQVALERLQVPRGRGQRREAFPRRNLPCLRAAVRGALPR